MRKPRLSKINLPTVLQPANGAGGPQTKLSDSRTKALSHSLQSNPYALNHCPHWVYLFLTPVLTCCIGCLRLNKGLLMYKTGTTVTRVLPALLSADGPFHLSLGWCLGGPLTGAGIWAHRAFHASYHGFHRGFRGPCALTCWLLHGRGPALPLTTCSAMWARL